MSEEFNYRMIYNENTGYGAYLWFLPMYVIGMSYIIGMLIRMLVDLSFKDCTFFGLAISIIITGCFFYFVETKIKIQDTTKMFKQLTSKLSIY